MAVNLKALLETTQLLHPNEVEDQTCPICYDDFLQDQSREFPRKLPCGHIIGTECLLLLASAQRGTTSIKCPWCTKPIIDSLGAEQIIADIISYAETAVDQAIEQIENWAAAMDLVFDEQKLEVVVATILLVVLGAYFDTDLAWLPLHTLYCCVMLTTRHHLIGHRRLGLIFYGIGFCVGETVHRDLGLDLLHFPKDGIPRFHIENLLGSPMARVGGVHFQPSSDVDDEVERDYGKRKSFLGTADFEYEDCALAKVKAYIEGFAKYVKENCESRAAVHGSSDS